VDGGGGLFSDGFQVRPFPFDGVEIGAVSGEIFERMAGVADEGLNGGAFVERRVVHEKNGARRVRRRSGVQSRTSQASRGRSGAKPLSSIETMVRPANSYAAIFFWKARRASALAPG
jgi:hypothetical protein